MIERQAPGNRQGGAALNRVVEGVHMRPTLKVIRGGKEIGDTVDRKPRGEPEHFTRCPTCGLMFDTRDLGQMLEHDGPLPHPSDRTRLLGY
jgi:hypothetical protein